MKVSSSANPSPTTGPLSFQQERCWKVLDAAYDVIPPLAFRIKGALNEKHLATALRALTRRQGVLRTTFDDVGGAVIQTVSPEAEVDFEVVDLSHLDKSEWDYECARLIRLEANRPFLLNHAPLMRVRLVRLRDDEHTLFFIVHHIIGDLWSMKILWRELAHLWTAAAETDNPDLDPLPMQYIDFASWQRKWFAGNVLQTHLAYLQKWARNVPDSTLPNVQLQEDKTRRGDVVCIELSAEVTEKVRQISRELRVTVFMMLLASFHIFLRRYTGADRFLVAAMVANRSSTEVESLIGVFATSLAMRMELPSKATLHDVAVHTREALLDAYANQYMPLWQLSQMTGQDLDPVRLRPRISFTLQSAPLKSHEIPGMTITEFASTGAAIFDGESGAVAPFDQSWEVWEMGPKFRVAVVYRRCFKRPAVEEMLKSFVDVLESIVMSLAKSPVGTDSTYV